MHNTIFHNTYYKCSLKREARSQDERLLGLSLQNVNCTGSGNRKSTYDLDRSAPEPQLEELYELNVAKGKILTRMRQVFVENNVDVIIGPAYQSCAVPHDTYGVATYTVFCNLFNVREAHSKPLTFI